MTQHLKKSKKGIKPSGFALHVELEHAINMELENPDAYLATDIFASRSRKKERPEPVFSESVGAVRLYLASEVSYLYQNVRRIFGDEKDRIVKEILEDLAKKKNRRNLAGSPESALIHQMRVDFPNFAEAIDQIEYAAALSKLSNKNWFQMSPLLLLGPPGVGKTAFVQAFAKMLGVYFRRIDIGTTSTGSLISGLSMGWSTGHTGEIFKAISEADTANPLLMLDEIDKMAGSSSYPVEPVLLGLLEKESAETFKEEAIKLTLNCKHFLWIATANNLEVISEPLKSRFTIVHVRHPNANEIQQIIRNIYRKILSTNPWGVSFNDEISDEVSKVLIEFSPREISRVLLMAFGRAALRRGEELLVSDVILPEKKSSKQYGFV
jgi:DNA replication protein DnaC